MRNFIKNVTITSSARFLQLIIGIIVSIILARSLGPKNKGIYALAAILPTLIITLFNLGIGKAITYYLSKKIYCKSVILFNNIFLSIITGFFGMCIGIIIIIFFRQNILPNVPEGYLFFTLILIPLGFINTNIQYYYLGLNKIKAYNIIPIINSFLSLIFLLILVKVLKLGIIGCISGSILSLSIALVISLYYAKKITGKISYKINNDFCKKVLKYGFQIQMGGIITFLNYRIDIFLINVVLGPTKVGFYTLGVGLVEQLSIVTHTISALLFPKIAGEKDIQRKNSITPIITRNIFWILSFVAIILFFLCHWIILILYSELYLPSVRPLQALLIGTIAISISSILWQDIAARGHVMLNNYIDLIVLAINIILNLLWIPKYGITGAAWASTFSYTFSLLCRLYFYCKLSNNLWKKVIFPQRDDWILYKKVFKNILKFNKSKTNNTFDY